MKCRLCSEQNEDVQRKIFIFLYLFFGVIFNADLVVKTNYI